MAKKRDEYAEREKKINAAARTRPFTKDTRWLIIKWFLEGDSVPDIAEVLSRTTTTVRRVLKNAGVYD